MSAKKQEADVLHKWQGDLWRMGLKLQSLGVILRLQGTEYEGCPEVQGIGLILSDLGDDLNEISVNLDDYLVSMNNR